MAKNRPVDAKVLELCLDRILEDAIVNYPAQGDALVLLQWATVLRNMVVEAAMRRNIPKQEKYKHLSIEEQVKVMFDKAEEEVTRVQKVEKRKADSEMYMSLKPVGPPPIKPEEKVDEEDDSDAEHYHPEPVLREPAPPRPRSDDDDGFIKREDGAYEWDGSEPD